MHCFEVIKASECYIKKSLFFFVINWSTMVADDHSTRPRRIWVFIAQCPFLTIHVSQFYASFKRVIKLIGQVA